MNKNLLTKSIGNIAVVLVLLAFMARLSSAHEVWLVAKPFTNTTLGVTMWGFAEDPDDFTDSGDNSPEATSPGPRISVPAGDTTGLTIHVKNLLAENISIVIPGLIPVAADAGKPVPLPSDPSRIRSFAPETAALGGTRSYSWTGVTSGTYMYHSGSHQARQVPMGLYGAVTKNAQDLDVSTLTQGVAYDADGTLGNADDVVFDNEVILFFSEIDTDFVNGVADLAIPVGSGTTALSYSPELFLINGETHPTLASPEIANGFLVKDENVLIRFLNAGLRNHVPTLNGANMEVIAEDGNLYPFSKEQYQVMLPALKTMDAVFTPKVANNYELYDRRLYLADANNAANPGGMFTSLNVLEGVQPIVSISKSAVNPVIDSGDQAVFNMSVINPGNVPLFNVMVTDTLCNGGAPLTLISGDDPVGEPGFGFLETGETWSYSCSVATTLGQTTPVSNTATVVADTGADLPAPSTVTANSSANVQVINPAIAITKTDIFGNTLQIVDDGSPATFKLTVDKGAGDALLGNITITDGSCDSLTVPPVPGDINTDQNLQTDEIWTYTCTTTPLSFMVGGFTTDAFVEGTALSGTTVSDTSPLAEVRVIIPEIAITSTTLTPTVNLGDTVVFTLNVTRAGSEEVAGDADLFMPNSITPDPLAVITNPSCDTLTFDGGDDDLDGELDLLETWTYTCTDSSVTGSYTNSSTATGTAKSGTELTSLSADVDVTVIAPAIAISMTPTSQTINSGDPATFTMIVSNPGNDDLTVNDPTGIFVAFDGGSATFVNDNANGNGNGNGDTTLNPGEGWTYTATITGRTADYLNQANVTVTDSLGGPLNANSNIVSVTVSTIVVPGGQIAYYPFTPATVSGNTAFDSVAPQMNLVFGPGVSSTVNGLSFTNGVAQAADASKVINAVQATNQVTFEAWIVSDPNQTADGAGRIISFGSSDASENYMLGLKRIVLRLHSPILLVVQD